MEVGFAKEIVAYQAAEHPYQIKDLHSGQVFGWVCENTVGTYTLADVTTVSKHVAGQVVLSADQIRIYDVNHDGELTLADVTQISNIVADY